MRRNLSGPEPDKYMPVIVSGIVLGVALWMVSSQMYPPETLKWAYGVIGTIMGYWLRPSSGSTTWADSKGLTRVL